MARACSYLAIFVCLILLIAGGVAAAKGIIKLSPYAKTDTERQLKAIMQGTGLTIGSQSYVRIFKETSELEFWVKNAQGIYALFKTYPICTFSGNLGPKLKEGDKQAPEGFYSITRKSLNPNSRYHLAMNIGYPNAYDRAHGRTGDYIMVHGNCVSIGCFAMGDKQIEEIYTLVSASLSQGQESVPIHIFPFRPTDARLTASQKDEWHRFWGELEPAYRLFEQTRQVPKTSITAGRYNILPH